MNSKLQHIPLIRTICAVGLLSLYMLGFIAVQSHPYHELFHHHHESEVCTAASELDACHRAIYHGDKKNGCKHDAHFIPTLEDCDWCDMLVPTLTTIFTKSEYTKVVVAVIQKSWTYYFTYHNQTIWSPPSRGPPTFF